MKILEQNGKDYPQWDSSIVVLSQTTDLTKHLQQSQSNAPGSYPANTTLHALKYLSSQFINDERKTNNE